MIMDAVASRTFHRADQINGCEDLEFGSRIESP